MMLSAVLLVPATAAASVLPRAVCGTSCGSFQSQKGSGFLRAWAKGTGYGSVGQGKIWLRDRTGDGHRGFSVSGYDRGPFVRSEGWIEYRGRNMSFLAGQAWGLRIDGSGINIRIVADGAVTLRGTGSYTVNGSRWRSWPSVARTIAL